MRTTHSFPHLFPFVGFTSMLCLLLTTSGGATIKRINFVDDYKPFETVLVWYDEDATINVFGDWLDISNKVEIRKKNGNLLSDARASLSNKRAGAVTVTIKIPHGVVAEEYEVWIRYPIETNGPDKFKIRPINRGIVHSIAFVMTETASAKMGGVREAVQRGATAPITTRAPRTSLPSPVTPLKIGTEYILEARGERLQDAVPRAMERVEFRIISQSATHLQFAVRCTSLFEEFKLTAKSFSDKYVARRNHNPLMEYGSFEGTATFTRDVVIDPIVTKLQTPKARIGDHVIITGERLTHDSYDVYLVVGMQTLGVLGNSTSLSVNASFSMDGQALKLRYTPKPQSHINLGSPFVVDVPGTVEVTGQIDVTVTDASNVPIQGATVCVGTEQQPGRLGSTTTGTTGTASLVIRPGNTSYTIRASKSGYSTSVLTATSFRNGVATVKLVLRPGTASNLAVCP